MRTDLTVNGEQVTADVEPRVLLVDLLRETLRLTGTKVACDTGQCGSCVVRLNDRSVKSCAVLAVQAQGADVVTIEGVNPADQGLNPVQQALRDAHATQCGFCTPGMVISLMELLEVNPKPNEEEIRVWLTGHLCRCTGYNPVVRAILSLTNGAGTPEEVTR